MQDFRELLNQILRCLEDNLFRDSQHGFRSGRSYLTNLLDFLEYGTNQLDKGENVDII